jgi:Glutaminase
MQSGDGTGFPFISTDQLPTPEAVTALVDDVHARFRSNNEGENSQVYPALAQIPGDLFGVCVVSIRGNVYEVGDTQYEFSIMSVSKPFVFALVCQSVGAEEAREKLGAAAELHSGGSSERPTVDATEARTGREVEISSHGCGLLAPPAGP